MKIPDVKNYPKIIYLKGTSYNIRFIKNFRYLGETDPNKKIIRIKAGMSKNETFRTLIHELLHLCELEWPVKIKHKELYKLEEALFSLLIDNNFVDLFS